jgi:TolA-binding protein
MTSHRAKGSSPLPFAVLPLLAPLVLATGCADSAGDALRQDMALIRQDVNALKVSAQRARTETDAVNQIDRRSRDQAATTTQQLNALSARIESMSSELNRVSNRLDEVSRRLDTVSRQAAQPRTPAPPPPGSPVGAPVTPQAPVPPTARPMPPAPPPVVPPAAPAPPPATSQAPPAAAAPPFAAPRPPGVPAPPVVVPPAPVTPGPGTPAPSTAAPPAPRPGPPAGRSVAALSAEDSYQAAYLDFSRGRYELAMSGFRDFLRRHPDSPLADSAQYGIGESYYSMATAAAAQGQSDKATQALEQSVQEFRKVIVIYPRGAKVPPALYKEALALAELKQTALARARLQYLVDNFPQSEEAPLAKERLSALK